MEMEEAMRDVETQLLFERCPKLSGWRFAVSVLMNIRRAGTDHISRTGFVDKSRMNPRDAPIRNQDDVYLGSVERTLDFRRAISGRHPHLFANSRSEGSHVTIRWRFNKIIFT
jgi:hypothetical protein